MNNNTAYSLSAESSGMLKTDEYNFSMFSPIYLNKKYNKRVRINIRTLFFAPVANATVSAGLSD
jgi:hypothetical protein